MKVKKNLTPPTRQDDQGWAISSVLKDFSSRINNCCWSPNGELIAVGLADTTIKIFSLKKMKQILDLKRHTGSVLSLAWSADSKILASGSGDDTIGLWEISNGQLLNKIASEFRIVNSLSWSRSNNIVASGSADGVVELWHGDSLEPLDGTFSFNSSGRANSLEWSPNGKVLAFGDRSAYLVLLNTAKLPNVEALAGHSQPISCVAWSPDGQWLLTGSEDKTIRVWNSLQKRTVTVLENHKAAITGISFSFDGSFFTSRSRDNKIFLWRSNDWEVVSRIVLPAEESQISINPIFHPKLPIIATGQSAGTLALLSYEHSVLSRAEPERAMIQYTNAKVVLVGEASTGKTCLARALMDKPFEPQESTHGMKVWNFSSEITTHEDGKKIMRETLLWDLAGQPEYQIVHQLFLDKTALGIVLFDPTHPEDPFRGVSLWQKALTKVSGDSYPKVLVAGRIDRGKPTATVADIKAMASENKFSAYVATSSKTGKGVADLKDTIKKLIPWDKLPTTRSPEAWKSIQEFLVTKRSHKDVLIRRSDLFQAYKNKNEGVQVSIEEFDIVLAHTQAQGLIWQLSFGDFILLKPELLNDYASSIVHVARGHKEGLGCVVEQDIIEARIDFEDMERIPDKNTERLLLYSVIELLLRREIALREGNMLVLPSKFNRKRPAFPELAKPEIVYAFSGNTEQTYATLIVRLNYCNAFELASLWKNAAEFRSLANHLCGVLLETTTSGDAFISVFFEKDVSIDSKVLFIRFIHEHINERSEIGSVKRTRIYRCPKCNEEVQDKSAIAKRMSEGKSYIPCLYCDEEIGLIDLLEERFGNSDLLRKVRDLEGEIIEKRDREVVTTRINAKILLGEFDVFLAHNSKDKTNVVAIGDQLKQRGIVPWLDIEQIPPGRWFQDVIQDAIPKVKTAAIIIGEHGLGKWQALELRTFISECVERDIPVIPVLLPTVSHLPSSLKFLKELNLVKFNYNIDQDKHAIDQLEWGITGLKPVSLKKK